MNRRSHFFLIAFPIAAILLCLLLGLSRSKSREQLEITKKKKPQEVKVIVVEEQRPKTVVVKKVVRKKALKPKQLNPLEPKKAPSPVKNLLAKFKKPGEPKVASKTKSRQKEDHTKHASAKKTAPPPTTYQLEGRVIDKGLRLINRSDAPVPVVEASYQQIGFEAYLGKMLEMGGQLFVGAPEKRKILARVVMENQGNGRSFQFFGLDTYMHRELEGMALFRPREITNEPLIKEIIKRSIDLFGEQDLRIVVLLPLSTEAGILGALTEYLTRQGFNSSDLDWVWGQYIEKRHSFSLRIEKGKLRKNQQIVKLNMIIEIN